MSTQHRERALHPNPSDQPELEMIRKLKSGEYRLYSRKKDKSGKRKNLGTFKSLAAAKKHERAVQYFKRAG
jgi:hypothetical protein